MNFPSLVSQISLLHRSAQLEAGRALQRLLSLRNWLIGAYIVAYEQDGEDRAAYGEQLLDRLSKALEAAGCDGLSPRNLRNLRQVALAYPGLDVSALHKALGTAIGDGKIWQTSAKSLALPSKGTARTDEPDLAWRDAAWIARLFTELTFSHLLELSRIDDPSRRAFYELHCLKEKWSVRELQRQRDSMLFERIGLSESREQVLALARQGVVDASPRAQLRDPYVFEFIGLRPAQAFMEQDLEQALIDHLQQFLLELGRDFCFMERQYRITLGNRHHYLDLLFFHRRLRCLVAIDLKLGEFQPEHSGQLRFYVSYLAENVALPDENPPVGILLCADKDEEVVHFATSGDDDLFVSRYQLELPSKEQLRNWLHEERARIDQTLPPEEPEDA